MLDKLQIIEIEDYGFMDVEDKEGVNQQLNAIDLNWA